jgi:hypothetical protein
MGEWIGWWVSGKWMDGQQMDRETDTDKEIWREGRL